MVSSPTLVVNCTNITKNQSPKPSGVPSGNYNWWKYNADFTGTTGVKITQRKGCLSYLGNSVCGSIENLTVNNNDYVQQGSSVVYEDWLFAYKHKLTLGYEAIYIGYDQNGLQYQAKCNFNVTSN